MMARSPSRSIAPNPKHARPDSQILTLNFSVMLLSNKCCSTRLLSNTGLRMSEFSMPMRSFKIVICHRRGQHDRIPPIVIPNVGHVYRYHLQAHKCASMALLVGKSGEPRATMSLSLRTVSRANAYSEVLCYSCQRRTWRKDRTPLLL